MVKNFSFPSRLKFKLTPILVFLSLLIGLTSAFNSKITVAMLVIIVGAIVVIWISTRWPEIFLIVAIWTNFMKSAYIPGLAIGEFGATPYMIFTALSLLGFGIQISMGKRQLVLPSSLWFLLLFMAFTTLSLLYTQNFRLAFGSYVRTLLDWIMMFLIVQMLIDMKKVHKLMAALLIQALVMATWGAIAGINLEISNVQRRALFFWQQYQKNDFAAYLGLVLILALATITLARTRRNKGIGLILLPLVPIGWIFTFSRGGFLAIVVSLFIFLSLERNKKLWQQSIVAIFLLGIFSGGFLTFSSSQARDLAVDGLISLVTGESEAERHTHTIDVRLELVEAALEVIADYPILGVGFNQWQLYSPITTRVYEPQINEFREKGFDIHNRYLGIAANSGLIALMGYVGFIATVLIIAINQRLTAHAALRTYINVFIAATVGMQVALLFAPEVLWEWPVIGILLGLINVRRREYDTRSVPRLR